MTPRPDAEGGAETSDCVLGEAFVSKISQGFRFPIAREEG